MREVTEKDFRRPEFRDADPADYEFRDDGAIVRKDRWERGIYSIVSIVGASRRQFEIDEIVAEVQRMKGDWCQADPDYFPECERIDVRLSCGSVLVGCEQMAEGYRWPFSGQTFGAGDFGSDVIEWQVTPSTPPLTT